MTGTLFETPGRSPVGSGHPAAMAPPQPSFPGAGAVVPQVSFDVFGDPVGQGNIRHLGAGRPAVHQNAKTLLPWRHLVQRAAMDQLAPLELWKPFDEPLTVQLVFTVRKPVSAPKRRRTWPDRRPDLDHLVRAVLDAATAAGVMVDDARVVDLRAVKTFPGEHPDALPIPGVRVRVWTRVVW